MENLAEVVRDLAGLKRDKRIDPETQFERDLGVTGDDGSELLEKVERHYRIEFTGESFDLKQGEYLFHSEGPEVVPIILSLFGGPGLEVRALSVGQLYRAVLREMSRANNGQQKEGVRD